MDAVLRDKVAIVTGAGKGQGAAIARALGHAGACVAVNDLNPDRAEGVAGSIRAQGGRAIAVTADVSNKFQCVHLIETTRQEWRRLDVVVNNAAVRPRDTVLKMDEWAWQRCLDVNLKGTFFMTQLAGRVMADENRDRGGVIINIGYRPASSGMPDTGAAYAASKAGVVGFTQACAEEFAAYGIRLFTVANSTEQASKPGGQAADLALPGDPPVLARAVLTLCLDGGRFPSGSAIDLLSENWS